jgi:hypothetical protein
LTAAGPALFLAHSDDLIVAVVTVPSVAFILLLAIVTVPLAFLVGPGSFVPPRA